MFLKNKQKSTSDQELMATIQKKLTTNAYETGKKSAFKIDMRQNSKSSQISRDNVDVWNSK